MCIDGMCRVGEEWERPREVCKHAQHSTNKANVGASVEQTRGSTHTQLSTVRSDFHSHTCVLAFVVSRKYCRMHSLWTNDIIMTSMTFTLKHSPRAHDLDGSYEASVAFNKANDLPVAAFAVLLLYPIHREPFNCMSLWSNMAMQVETDAQWELRVFRK